MPSPIPIYTAHDEKYRADSCRPLLTAAGKTLRLAALNTDTILGTLFLPERLRVSRWWAFGTPNVTRSGDWNGIETKASNWHSLRPDILSLGRISVSTISGLAI